MSARIQDRPGQDAIAQKGWRAAHKWLLLRRTSQIGILALFMISALLAVPHSENSAQSDGNTSVQSSGSSATPLLDVSPLQLMQEGGGVSTSENNPAASPKNKPKPTTGFWIIKGNLSSSLFLDAIPLTDPYLLLQMLAAGFKPAATAILGALIVAIFYLLIGGRVFCSWVCPVNMITDAASWARRRFGIKANHPLPANTRYWFMGGTFVAAALTGTLALEWVNPVSLAHRGLLFGMGAGLWFLVGVFLYDLFVAQRGWCGHLCPMGAFYSLLGKTALIRVAAPLRDDCNDCMDCFAVCPEPQVIRPALKKVGQDSPVIFDSRCTTCGRCIDVCGKKVFRLTHRFNPRSSS
ncbi:MAG: quinol dehydrogenase ferredoxin subunit NapH [Azoarcus sp.]|jgi:ferredoxin-type protein NapH|nr:quinol dehydrogenase ferredoxin subunit NapH [Azoarcus sp.]